MKGQKLLVRRANDGDSSNMGGLVIDSCGPGVLDEARLAWISKLAGTLVGAAWEAPESSPEHVVLRTLLVDTPVRSLNIGRIMLREIERIASESGARTISIEPTVPEEFLRQAGYSLVAHRYQKELV